MSAKQYRVLRGLNYGTVRREPGDVVSDIPPGSVNWLVEQRVIEPVVDAPPRSRDRKGVSA